jgi:hypothetical protein
LFGNEFLKKPWQAASGSFVPEIHPDDYIEKCPEMQETTHLRFCTQFDLALGNFQMTEESKSGRPQKLIPTPSNLSKEIIEGTPEQIKVKADIQSTTNKVVKNLMPPPPEDPPN